MSDIAKALDFRLEAGNDFVRAAVYFSGMDYLDYVREDCVKIYDRVDRFLTVILNEEGDMIGFKLKGIKNYFLTRLQPALSLEDDDFVWVRDIFVALATAHGDEMFHEDERKEQRVVAYRRAARIAREDRVKFIAPRELMAA